MHVAYRVEDPGSIVYEMTLSMSLAEWIALQEAMEAGDPPTLSVAGRLRSEIIWMVRKARNQWTREVPSEDVEGNCGSPE